MFEKLIDDVVDDWINSEKIFHYIEMYTEDDFVVICESVSLSGISTEICDRFKLWDQHGKNNNEFKEKLKIVSPEKMTEYIIRHVYRKIKNIYMKNSNNEDIKNIEKFGDLKLGMTYIISPSLHHNYTLHEIVVLKKRENCIFVYYNPDADGGKCWELNTKKIGRVIESFPTEVEYESLNS